MSRNTNQTRTNKFEKRRKSTKAITIGIVSASVLLIILLGVWLFGGGDSGEETAPENENTASEEDSDFLITEPDDENNDSTEQDNDEQNNQNENNEANEEEEDEDNSSENVDIESAEPSDDNVSEAYTGDWEPIGTEQEGPHTTNYSDGSQDRIEIKAATAMVTDLNPETMVEWYVENGGDQQVIATVSDPDETQTYRVFLQWVDEQGWQPTKVEELIENDRN